MKQRMDGVMNWDEIQQKMQWVHDRSSILRQQLNTLSEPSDGFQEALEQLSLTLEELYVAIEEVQHTQGLLEFERWNYQDLFEFAPDGYLVTDSSGKIQAVNQAACLLLKRNQKFLIGKALVNVVVLSARSAFRQKLEQLQVQTQTWETMLQPAQGEPIVCEIKVSRIIDHEGQMIGLRWRILDITERKRAEAERLAALRELAQREQAELQMKASLQEKELLLKEIHHRVKNNLQMISSLLALQAHHLQHPQLQQAFADCQTRIEAMAFVHEQFYRSTHLDKVNFQTYIQNLTDYLLDFHSVSTTVAIHLDIDPITFSIEVAIPCGLIINELVCNAIKHAFLDRDSGKIVISLAQVEGGQLPADADNWHVADGDQTDARYYRLTVSDNGIGLRQQFDLHSTNSFGLRLVVALSQQLDAHLKVDSDQGTRFQIFFAAV